MKKLLIILGVSTLITIPSASLIACNNEPKKPNEGENGGENEKGKEYFLIDLWEDVDSKLKTVNLGEINVDKDAFDDAFNNPEQAINKQAPYGWLKNGVWEKSNIIDEKEPGWSIVRQIGRLVQQTNLEGQTKPLLPREDGQTFTLEIVDPIFSEYGKEFFFSPGNITFNFNFKPIVKK